MELAIVGYISILLFAQLVKDKSRKREEEYILLCSKYYHICEAIRNVKVLNHEIYTFDVCMCNTAIARVWMRFKFLIIIIIQSTAICWYAAVVLKFGENFNYRKEIANFLKSICSSQYMAIAKKH